MFIIYYFNIACNIWCVWLIKIYIKYLKKIYKSIFSVLYRHLVSDSLLLVWGNHFNSAHVQTAVRVFNWSAQKTSESRRGSLRDWIIFVLSLILLEPCKKQQLFILNAEKLGELKEAQCVMRLRGVFDSFPSVMSVVMIICNWLWMVRHI